MGVHCKIMIFNMANQAFGTINYGIRMILAHYSLFKNRYPTTADDVVEEVSRGPVPRKLDRESWHTQPIDPCVLCNGY